MNGEARSANGEWRAMGVMGHMRRMGLPRFLDGMDEMDLMDFIN